MIAGKSDEIDEGERFVVARRDSTDGNREANAPHRLGKFAAIFCHANRARIGADERNTVRLENSGVVQLHRDVERRLAAHRGKESIRFLFLDHELDELSGDGLDVRPVGELRIGHDRRRIGVDEDDLEPLFLERLRRLGPGIVELGALPDDDRAGADDENAMEVVARRHR